MINIDTVKKITPMYNTNKLVICGNKKEPCFIEPGKQNDVKQNIKPKYEQQHNSIIFEIY